MKDFTRQKFLHENFLQILLINKNYLVLNAKKYSKLKLNTSVHKFQLNPVLNSISTSLQKIKAPNIVSKQ